MGKQDQPQLRGVGCLLAFLVLLCAVAALGFLPRFVRQRAQLAARLGIGTTGAVLADAAVGGPPERDFAFAWIKARGETARSDLIVALSDADPAIRRAAIDALPFVSPHRREELIDVALTDADAVVRRHAGANLAHSPVSQRSARMAAVRLLCDATQPSGVRVRAAEMLQAIDRLTYLRAWSPVPSKVAARDLDRQLLAVALDENEEPGVREAAAGHLHDVDGAVRDALHAGLRSDKPATREVAALALIAVEGSTLADVEALTPLLTDDVPGVRSRALNSLGVLAIRAIPISLQGGRLPWPGVGWRPRAAWPAMRSAVAGALETALTTGDDVPPAERLDWALALGELRDPAEEPSEALRALATDDHFKVAEIAAWLVKQADANR